MKRLLSITVTLILVGLIIWQLGGVGEVANLLVQINLFYLALVLLLNLVDRLFMNYKWLYLLGDRGIQFPFWRSMKIYSASLFLGTFLPTSVGADAIRAIDLSRNGLDGNEAVASIIIERLAGLFGLLALVLIALFLFSRDLLPEYMVSQSGWIIALLLVGALITFMLFFSQPFFDLLHNRLLANLKDNRFLKRLRHLHETILSYRHHKHALAVFMGLTFIEQFFPIAGAWLIAAGLGLPVTFIQMAMVLPLPSLLSRLPISIGGIGVFESVFIILLSQIGISVAEAVTISLIARLSEIVVLFPWYLARMLRMDQPKIARSVG